MHIQFTSAMMGLKKHLLLYSKQSPNNLIKLIESSEILNSVNNPISTLYEKRQDIYQNWKENNFNIDHEFTIKIGSTYKFTLLHLAAVVGNLKLVEALLKNGANVGKKQFYYKSIPLHFAAHYGHKDVVLALLKNGADVNAKNNTSETPLHFAAEG